MRAPWRHNATSRSRVLHESAFLARCEPVAEVGHLLSAAGFDVTHVSDVGLEHAKDDAIFDFAAERNAVVITADSDFSTLLALRRAVRPSVVVLRHVANVRPAGHAALLIANLPTVSADLLRGAVVSLSPTRMSVRELPVQ